MTDTSSINPFNVLIGAWMRDRRHRLRRSIKDMAANFAPDLKESYVRSVEAGANAMPVAWVPGLVFGFGLSFPAAAQLGAAIRLLDVRVPRDVDAERPFDLLKLAEHAAILKSMWPKAGPSLSWLQGQIEELRNDGGRTDAAQRVRDAARAQVSVLDDVLEEVSNDPAAQSASSPSPIIDDILKQLALKLARLKPQMTRRQHREWEDENASRMTAVWGVVSNGSDVWSAIGNFDWGFLNNRHRPSLWIAIGDPPSQAQELEAEFRRQMARKYSRLRAGHANGPDINIRSYERHRSTAEDLFYFDRANWMIADAALNKSRSNLELIKMSNCWIYQLGNQVHDQSLIGFLDNYSESNPEYFSADLSSIDLAKWRGWMAQVDAGHD